jgi:hypothetical protein
MAFLPSEVALGQKTKQKGATSSAVNHEEGSQKTKSGKYWVKWADTHALNSNSLDELDPAFRRDVKAFKKALEDAGATVVVASTKRNIRRAYLFHWSWKIANKKCKAEEAKLRADVPIDWIHDTEEKSIEAAKEMTSGFRLAMPPKSNVAPSLSSNHIHGKAIDMKITWKNKINIKKRNGKTVEVTYIPNVNSNTQLHEVGKSYGVKKHLSDAPHWSHNGR